MLKQLIDRNLLTRFRVLELQMLAPYSSKKFIAGHSLDVEVRKSIARLRERGF